MAAHSIPASATDITAEWLQQVLKISRGQDLCIKSIVTKDGYQEGKGWLSNMVQVEAVVGNDGEKLQLVAKLLPTVEVVKGIVIDNKMNVTEICGYREVLHRMIQLEESRGSSELRHSVPEYIYGDYNQLQGKSLLLLEDLGPKGYDNVDIKQGLDVPHSILAAKTIARLHAASYALQSTLTRPVREEFPFVFSLSNQSSSLISLAYDGFQRFATLYDKYPALLALKDRLSHATSSLMQFVTSLEELETSSPHQVVLTQLDFWNNNFMFRTIADGTLQMKLVDWQMLAYTHPFMSLAMFFLSSTNDDCRENHLQDILDAYWNTFIARCHKLQVDPPQTKEEFMANLDSYGWYFGLLWCMTCANLFYDDPVLTNRLVNITLWVHHKGAI